MVSQRKIKFTWFCLKVGVIIPLLADSSQVIIKTDKLNHNFEHDVL